MFESLLTSYFSQLSWQNPTPTRSPLSIAPLCLGSTLTATALVRISEIKLYFNKDPIHLLFSGIPFHEACT
jgi:hypothetical protein